MLDAERPPVLHGVIPALRVLKEQQLCWHPALLQEPGVLGIPSCREAWGNGHTSLPCSVGGISPFPLIVTGLSQAQGPAWWPTWWLGAFHEPRGERAAGEAMVTPVTDVTFP